MGVNLFQAETSILFSHVLPITTRHVAELLPGIHPLLDADGLEVSAPKPP